MSASPDSQNSTKTFLDQHMIQIGYTIQIY